MRSPLLGPSRPRTIQQRHPSAKEQPVTIVQAVTEYLGRRQGRVLSDATLYKLDIFFRKQFLVWCKSEGHKLLREVDLRTVQSFRASWVDGAMSKKKKQGAPDGLFLVLHPLRLADQQPYEQP